ncbi:MAG: NeuD/PglB/VioB family sugar acetyltransferase, partial [Myxococcota bacterium]
MTTEEARIDMRQIIVYGAGGHGKVVADIVRTMPDATLLGFVDDRTPVGAMVLGAPVLGSSGLDAPGLGADRWLRARGADDGAEVALGIGDNHARERVAARCVEAGFALATLVHPTAAVSSAAVLAAGVVVMAQAAINPGAVVEEGAIINTGAVVEHDVRVGPYAHVSPHATLAGGASVGRLSHVGAGATCLPLTSIGEDVTVGGGAVVHRAVPDRVVTAGVPARILRLKAPQPK